MLFKSMRKTMKPQFIFTVVLSIISAKYCIFVNGNNLMKIE